MFVIIRLKVAVGGDVVIISSRPVGKYRGSAGGYS
jgi:hypothetical protein